MSETVAPPIAQGKACGKFILFGEHSILYGGKALSIPVKTLSLSIEISQSIQKSLICEDFKLENNSIENFWKLIERDFPFFSQSTFKITSNIPIGAGLGSSAALCISLHKAAFPPISSEELIKKSWMSENFFHGKSSGLDPCTIATEKILEFQNINHFQYINTPQAFLSETPKKHLFVITDSGIRRSTSNTIGKTQGLKDNNPQLWEKTIHELQEIVKLGIESFQASNISELGSLMNQAHLKLSDLDVSHREIEDKRNKYLEAGAIGAKLTGAGRGGFFVSLFETNQWTALKSRNRSQLGSFFEIWL